MLNLPSRDRLIALQVTTSEDQRSLHLFNSVMKTCFFIAPSAESDN